MNIGIPKEIKTLENRVSMTPGAVESLVRRGHTVLVEAGAGLGSGLTDDAYVAAGARLVDAAAAWGATMDGLALGVEGLAYSFDQKKEGSSSYNRSEFQQNPWAFGFNGLVRYYPIRTDMASFFIGSGLGGMFSNDRIPYYTNGGRGNYSSMTLPADIGVTFNLTQTVGLELVGRYQRIGFDDHGLDSWGGHAGVKISF